MKQMTSADIHFTRAPFDYQEAQLPYPDVRFMDRPVTVCLEPTQDNSAPHPSALELLDRVLKDLPRVLSSAEEALSRYESHPDSDFRGHINNPQIWMPLELDLNDPSRWTFVVERDDWPDFGWHIEFREEEVLEVWAGD